MRKRRNRATWLPVSPTYFTPEGLGQTWFSFQMQLGPPVEQGDTIQRAIPLTMDETPDLDEDQGTHTLRDYVEGQDFILDRVVGKAHIGISQDAEAMMESAMMCIALAVLPTEAGGTQPSIPAEEWNPFFAQNSQQPWLFRRTWMMSNAARSSGTSELWPVSNSIAPGSLQDGPHIDTKVKRRIRKEQRLYIVFAASIDGTNTDFPNGSFFPCSYDLRVLGHMVRGGNKSVF